MNVEDIRKEYPVNTRILLEHMDDNLHPVPDGTRGSVVHVDDGCQIHMKWDNGRSLALVPEVDTFRKLTAEELEQELEERLMEEAPDQFAQFFLTNTSEEIVYQIPAFAKDDPSFLSKALDGNSEFYLVPGVIREYKDILATIEKDPNFIMYIFVFNTENESIWQYAIYCALKRMENSPKQ